MPDWGILVLDQFISRPNDAACYRVAARERTGFRLCDNLIARVLSIFANRFRKKVVGLDNVYRTTIALDYRFSLIPLGSCLSYSC